jgi:DNA repair protein RadC
VGNLSQVKSPQLCALPGIGQSKAAQVLAAVELGRRVLGKNGKAKIRLSSTKDVFEYLRIAFKGERKERFTALYLDAKNRLLGQETVSVGILDSSHAHPREIFQGAIASGAKSLIVAHNHPSGDASPSKEDREVTKRLREAGKILGIELLDHIIVGDTDCVSMREEGCWVG